MAEIALRTTERLLQKVACFHWRPRGATIVCCSDSQIRGKWLGILCDLVSPKKRKDYGGLPGFQRLCDAWTPQLREAWLAYDRPTKAHPLGRLLQDRSYPQVVWAELIEPIGVLPDLPLAPGSDVPIYNTWLWSDRERKDYFLVVNSDADSETVEGWQGVDHRDADTGEVLPGLSSELFTTKPAAGFYEPIEIKGVQYWREVYDPVINLAIVWKKQIRYETDLGLSGGTLADIANPDKVLNPRFDKPVVPVKVLRPDLADLSVVGSM